jgi:hypothetical protein
MHDFSSSAEGRIARFWRSLVESTRPDAHDRIAVVKRALERWQDAEHKFHQAELELNRCWFEFYTAHGRAPAAVLDRECALLRAHELVRRKEAGSVVSQQLRHYIPDPRDAR